jgi:hypothetical protein
MIAGLTRQKEELKAIIPHKEESLIRAVLPLTSIKVTNFISTDRQLLGTCRSAFHRKLPTLLFISDTSVQKIAAYSDILLPALLRAHSSHVDLFTPNALPARISGSVISEARLV